MRRSRRLTLSAHGAVEAVSGMVIMLSPIVLPVSAAGLIVLGLLGALVTGSGLGVIVPSRRDSVAAHTGIDGALVLASAAGALALALAGQAPAAIALSALVAVQASLSFVTSYATAS
ncbi:MAG TPA: hypothetical protein VGF81_04040 [Solirubrobacteraceae bacterium]